MAGIEEKLANLPLAYGPTGSIGFELASGLPTATSTSDLDLLIRAPERLPMQLAKKLITIFSGSLCRVDVQLETPRGAVSLAEYASGQTPLLLRQNDGPILVDDPWEFHHRDTENTEVGDRDRPKAGLSEVRCSVPGSVL